jgi:hypothetical protein
MKRLFLLLALLAAAGASAQQYKWVDKDGKVRYGDVPPPGVKATPLKPPPPGAAPPAAAAAKKDAKGAEKALSPEAAFRKRQDEAQKELETKAQADKEAQAKKENCDQAQAALRSLESGQRIAKTDSKGERYFLDESQTAQELAKARQSVQQWCS